MNAKDFYHKVVKPAKNETLADIKDSMSLFS
jgi:hypothetical protein